MGIDEDPVTGSAHCVLAPYWAQVLAKRRLRARQCSPRSGDVCMALGGEEGAGAGEGRVLVSGPARVVLRGVLVL